VCKQCKTLTVDEENESDLSDGERFAGSKPGEFDGLTSVATCGNWVVAADQNNKRVQVFKLKITKCQEMAPTDYDSVNFEFAHEIEVMWANGEGRTKDERQFESILAVAVCSRSVEDRAEEVVLVSHHDGGDGDHEKLVGCISEYRLENGSFLRSFGSDHLQGPSTMAVLPGGELAVTDFRMNQVLVFQKDGTLRCKFGNAVLFDSPNGIVSDEHGNIAVFDSMSPRLHIFNSQGELIRSVETMPVGEYEEKGIKLDSKGAFLVVSPDDNRVSIWNVAS
jgi:hypothetical protein